VTEGTAGSRLAIHAVVRNRLSEKALDVVQALGEGPEYRLVDSGELAAVVTDADGPMEPAETLRRHGRIVARLLRRSSIVPVPIGLIARDEGAVRAFLERQRVLLLEALEYLEDGYELRLHFSARRAGHGEDQLRAVAHHVYEQLQRQTRAARILTEGGRERLLSAAFLIPRSEWIRFVEQVADWEGRYPAVRMDVTGPWAAWDFVHVMPAGFPVTGREET
jgi:hypothetical protein